MTDQAARGAFIVFEGIDGSGKSTQARLLTARLQDAGVPVHQTAEPTNGPVGTLIRNGFNRRVDLDDRVIASLFVADRLDHITNTHDGMLGIVERGTTVLCDRYHLSSQAYQASDVGSDWIASSNSISTDLMLPDLTIYLDVSPEVALERLASGRTTTDRFEVDERLRAARERYAEAIEQADEVVVTVDADRSTDELADAVWHEVSTRLDLGSLARPQG
ncbi:dTMP kinase [Frigoribacterium sp. NPDC087798]|uniref:dTMP kinase n=1 Tax=Frigoribacterium sp. NPDC087798 TaxID=3363993 RepID=UPI0037F600A9